MGQWLVHVTLGNFLIQSSLLFFFRLRDTLDPVASLTDVKERVGRLLVNSWKIWPVVNLVNLFWVPMNYRVLFVNVVGFFWNTYLNWYAHHFGKNHTK